MNVIIELSDDEFDNFVTELLGIVTKEKAEDIYDLLDKYGIEIARKPKVCKNF